MSDDRRFEQEARRWLELGPTQAPDRAVQAVLLAIETTPQQRGAHAPWRMKPMFGPLRAAVLAALLLALGLGVGPLGLLSGLEAPATLTLPPTACPSDEPLASGSIATIAGTGINDATGDGSPATAATIRKPFTTLAVDPTGAVYFSDPFGPGVRRIGLDGIVTTFAGKATGAPFVFPIALAFDADGDLLVADPGEGASRIWRVDPQGGVSVVAGNGVMGDAGDGGPADEAAIDAWWVAAGPQGDVYLEHAGTVVRTVDAAGGIRTFAGTRSPGQSGDGGPATAAALSTDGGIAVGPSGEVYIASGDRIRMVDTSGVITTIAGTGTSGLSGDGGPAIDAQIAPHAIAVDADGSIYFADMSRDVVRRIDPAGVITTIAGTGQGGFGGDCGPAREAQLDEPTKVAVRDGVVYVVDEANGRIRMIVP